MSVDGAQCFDTGPVRVLMWTGPVHFRVLPWTGTSDLLWIRTCSGSGRGPVIAVDGARPIGGINF